MPASVKSVGDSSMLAANPPDTPAKAAASPASGCRPAAWKSDALSGSSSTYPTSPAVCDMAPAHTTPHVRPRPLAAPMMSRTVAPSSPLRSATDRPSMLTSSGPIGPKPVKLGTTLSTSRCRPSTDSRLTTATLLPVSGWATATPSDASSADSSTTPADSSTKSVAGCGSALPARSTRASSEASQPSSTNASCDPLMSARHAVRQRRRPQAPGRSQPASTAGPQSRGCACTALRPCTSPD